MNQSRQMIEALSQGHRYATKDEVDEVRRELRKRVGHTSVKLVNKLMEVRPARPVDFWNVEQATAVATYLQDYSWVQWPDGRSPLEHVATVSKANPNFRFNVIANLMLKDIP